MPDLPASLKQNPRLADWIEFNNPNKAVTVRTGKVELGQGIKTAIALIAAEELDLRLDQVDVQTGKTSVGPNEFMTAGSMSIEGSGVAVRQVAAEVRCLLLDRAATKLNADVKDLFVEEGLIRHKDRNDSITYWDLDNDYSQMMATGEAEPKNPALNKLVGGFARRLDLPAKIRGGVAFIQDEMSDETLFGRVIRPPGLAHELISVETGSVEKMNGVVKIIVDGSFIGLVATDPTCANQAAEKLRTEAVWQVNPDHRLPADIRQFLLNSVGTSLLVQDGTPVQDPIPTRHPSPQFRAQYYKPYTMHGSLAPSAAVATFTPENAIKLHILSHSQGPFVIRGAIAQALDMDEESIVVEHRENAGCYGHNGADDAAFDAALLALSVPNKKIMLQWQRQDEHLWEPYSPAMLIDLSANIERGRIKLWQADVYSQTHMSRPIPFGSVSNLLGAWQKSDSRPRAEPRPGFAPHGGIHRNSDPYYEIEEKIITKNLVPDQRVRTSSTRGLGAFANVFAIETFMDEIAHEAEIDPIQLRRDHLSDVRATEILDLMQLKANKFHVKVDRPLRYGFGYAFARYKNAKCYAGVVVHLTLNEETFELKLLHADIVADAGLVIDRDGLANQLEGGFIQAASWTLKEEVKFDEYNSISTDWESYPILRFTEIPTVEVTLLDQINQPGLGAGEATQGPTPAAISNAIFNAVGLRLRSLPFTPDKLREEAIRAI